MNIYAWSLLLDENMLQEIPKISKVPQLSPFAVEWRRRRKAKVLVDFRPLFSQRVENMVRWDNATDQTLSSQNLYASTRSKSINLLFFASQLHPLNSDQRSKDRKNGDFWKIFNFDSSVCLPWRSPIPNLLGWQPPQPHMGYTMNISGFAFGHSCHDKETSLVLTPKKIQNFRSKNFHQI